MKRTLLFCMAIALNSFQFIAFTQTVTVDNQTISGYNEGVGVNINFDPSKSWTGATYIAQMCDNGGFEGAEQSGGDAGVVDGWKMVPQSSTAIYSASTSNAYKGKQCQKIVIKQNNEGLQNWRLKYKLNTANQYTIKFALKAENDFNSDVDLRIRYWNTNGNQYSSKFTPTNQWQVFEWTFTPDQNDELGELYINAHGPGTIYIDDFQFYITGTRRSDGLDGTMVDHLKYFQPASLRWGAIPANFVGMNESTLPEGEREGMSYGLFFKLCEEVNTLANLCIGVHEPTDYYTDKTTVDRLLEYIGGPANTQGGALREADGYGEFLTNGKGFIIEFGNEVWGGSNEQGTDHGSPWTQDTRKEYIAWCRERMSLMRTNQYFDANKYKLAYCGRQVNYQWFDKWDMINGENGEGDWWSVGGYMGGNFQEDISLNSGQLNYYMSGFSFVDYQKSQVQEHYAYMEQTIGKRLPLFMYEGNFDQSDYFNKLGQAIVYLDYSAAMIKEGVELPTYFIFAGGGQWAMINNLFMNYKRQPLYYAGALLNRYCKGNILSTTISGGTTHTQPAWSINGTNYPEQTWNTISHYAYEENGRFAVLLINRDFENDQTVTINIPTGSYKDTASLYTLSGNTWNDFNIYDNYDNNPEQIKISHQTVQNFASGSSVSVPKHSAVVLNYYDQNATSIQEISDFEANVITLENGNWIALIEAHKNAIGTLEVVDITGKKVKSINIHIPKGSNRIELEASGFSRGIYLLQFNINGYSKSVKVIR